MKKIVFIASLLISTLAFAQAVDLPDVVAKAFDNKFPEVEDVEWKQLKTNYQATFEDVEITMALFTSDGKWLKTAVIVSEDELPVVAMEHIEENFEDAEITQVQMIESNNEEISYLVVIITDDEKLKIKFDDEGIVIEK